MRYFSLFSGIGGFENGFPKEWQCVGYSEIDRFAASIYRYHYPRHRNFGDATRIVSAQLPRFDLLVGGFPCQSFSSAGKRQGFEDYRGTLFFEIARFCRDLRPRYLLLENVKGLVSNDAGQTFITILGLLSRLGYRVQWQILNSKDFGVPQNRERIFIIGYFGDGRGPEIFPLRNGNQEVSTDEAVTTWAAIQRPQGKFKGRKLLEIAPTLRPASRHNTAAICLRGRGEANKRRIEYKTDGTAYCLGASLAGLPLISDNVIIRRLTPLECERLQGFPDHYTQCGIGDNGQEIEISDTQRYKVLGNAVTVNVARAIGEKFKKLGN